MFKRAEITEREGVDWTYKAEVWFEGVNGPSYIFYTRTLQEALKEVQKTWEESKT